MLLCFTCFNRHVTEGLLKGVDPVQAVQYTAMEKATAAEILKAQEEVVHIHGHPQQNVAGVTAESQASVKSEVIPFSTMTVHHIQSSPVVIQQSQHSSALINHTQNSPAATSHSVGLSATNHQTPTTSVTVPDSTAASQQSQTSPSPQVSVNGSTMQSLFIEEIHSASTRNRAVSIEVWCILFNQFPLLGPKLVPVGWDFLMHQWKKPLGVGSTLHLKHF